MQRVSCARGFTVVEAIVALAIVASGVVGLVGLARQVTDTVARSRRHLTAAVLADAAVAERLGEPMTVTAADCLSRDVGGCMDELDGDGRPSTTGVAFVRRWRVVPLAGSSPPVWSLTVCVVPVEQRRGAAVAPGACVSRFMTTVQP